MRFFLVPMYFMTDFLRTLWELFKEPQYRSLLVWIIGLLLVGMIFYRQVEGWSWLDALYFSVITLSTVGYGDLSPDTSAAKIFTMVYIVSGISIFVSFASMLVKERQEIRQQRLNKGDEESNG